MPYYIGDVIKDRIKLVARTPEQFRESGTNVLINSLAEAVDPDRGLVYLSDGSKVSYDFLALGTGVHPIKPGIPGENLEGVFVLKSLDDAVGIKSYIEEKSCRKALIIGAGFIGLEMCENLKLRGMDVQIIHRGRLPANRWDPELAEDILEAIRKQGVDFITASRTLSIEKGTAYHLRLNTDQGPLEGDMIILAIGVKPDVTLAQQMGLAIGRSGAIQVNLSQRTSRESVYAVGDCAEAYHRVSRKWVHIPLGDIANKQGRIVGSTIGGAPRIFPGVVGAQAFRIFQLEVAATGIDEREATESGFMPVSTIVRGNAIANALPDPKRLALKLTADRSTGVLLGAQAVGEAGAVSRINSLSVALWAGLTLGEIYNLDFAYSPPFSGAWDIIHIASRALLQKM
jgi:CoA-dependent NAD(P)H sulfur oxidoreductase